MPSSSTLPARRASYSRCQISNGSSYFLGDVDHRTLLGRRHIDLFEDYLADLGGFSAVSTARRELIRRAAAVGAWCDQQEAALVNGDAVDVTQWLSAVDRHRRLLTTVGLERTARDVTPDLQTYIAERAE